MRNLSPLLMALLIVSCGKKAADTKSPAGPRNVVATNQSTKPIPLTSDRSKSLCSVETLDESQKNLRLSLFIQGMEVEEDRHFSGLIDGLQVRDIGGAVISKSTKDLSLLYRYISTDDVVTQDQKILSPQSPISICPGDGNYSRGSIESAALNATYFISKTSRKVAELLPSVKIPAVELQIAPLIKKSISVIIKGEEVWKFEAFDTDNAYYSPVDKTITFLPHSEEFRKAGMSMSFWEVPMVASHEYGHHVFDTLHPYQGNVPAKNCFGKMGLQGDTVQAGKRTVKNEDVLGALNEGFADLVSFYTLDNKDRGLKGVPCLEISRDVSSGVFANGTAKIFSEEALKGFFAEQEVPTSTCDAPNFQDIHIIGAIFANGADRLLALSTDSKDRRLSIVLSWLQELKSMSGTMKTPSPPEYLRESFKLLVETAARETDGKIDLSECEISREIYPGIESSISACQASGQK